MSMHTCLNEVKSNVGNMLGLSDESKFLFILRFLNKGAIMLDGDINDDGSARNSWELCSIQQIEEVKCLIRIVPISFSGILCFVAMAQQYTFIIFQAFTMDCHLGPHFEIPAGSVSSISLIALTVFIPIYDQLMVPLARKLTGVEGGITHLQQEERALIPLTGAHTPIKLEHCSHHHWTRCSASN